jgi:hypothetical protein
MEEYILGPYLSKGNFMPQTKAAVPTSAHISMFNRTFTTEESNYCTRVGHMIIIDFPPPYAKSTEYKREIILRGNPKPADIKSVINYCLLKYVDPKKEDISKLDGNAQRVANTLIYTILERKGGSLRFYEGHSYDESTRLERRELPIVPFTDQQGTTAIETSGYGNTIVTFYTSHDTKYAKGSAAETITKDIADAFEVRLYSMGTRR